MKAKTKNAIPAKRGLAAMTPERRSEIARLGGLAVPAEKRPFAQDAKLAAKAGKKGGRNKPAKTEENEGK